MIPIDENDARWIRVLRVDLGCTWERVAELFAVATGRTVNGGGTEGGADLCRYAASLLGEEYACAPWN
jgi:hypothetical protein